MTATTLRNAVATFVGVPVRTQTYRNLLYLVLSFPLGLAYFVFLTFGLSLGVGLSFTLIGVPTLVATLASVHVLANAEARLTNRLLGTDIPTASIDTTDGILVAAKRVVTAPRTWLGVAHLLVKFAFGVVAFTALVTTLSISGSLLAAPLTYSPAYWIGFGMYQIGFGMGGPFESVTFVVDTFPEAVGVAVAGLVAGVVSLHVLNGLARASGLATRALLGAAEPN